MQTMLDLEELYNTYTAEEQIKESYERRTAPTGRYTFRADRASARQMNEDSPLWPGRKMATLAGRLLDDQGATKGRIQFDASWEVVRKDNGKMDGPSILWGQLCTALNMKDRPVGEIIEAAKQYPLSVYVTESFRTPSGWQVARDPDERRELRRAGYEAKNFVQSVSRANH